MNHLHTLSALLLASTTAACMSQVGTPGGGGKVIPGECEDHDFHLELSTEADLDDIPKGCFVLAGDLRITRSTLRDLTPLADLAAVRGSLIIEDNTALTTLAGVIDLEVDGDILIEGNTRLADVDGLGAVRDIGHLTIRDNDALADLGGLRALETIAGDAIITDNPALPNLTGLDALRAIDGRLDVQGNAALRTLAGLGNLTTVRAVDVSRNAMLWDLSGLGVTRTGAMTIRENPALTSLSTLKLREVDADLDVQQNGLTQLAASSLIRVGGNFIVANNPQLGTIDGLPSALVVSRDLRITSNTRLASVYALYQGVHAATLTVTSNPALSSSRWGHLDEHDTQFPFRVLQGNGTNQSPGYEQHGN